MEGIDADCQKHRKNFLLDGHQKKIKMTPLKAHSTGTIQIHRKTDSPKGISWTVCNQEHFACILTESKVSSLPKWTT